MNCPICSHKSDVTDSRRPDPVDCIRRRRVCLNCKHRFTTYERIEPAPIAEVKRRGDRESLDSSKLLQGIARACEKTSDLPQEQQCVVADVATDIQQCTLRELACADIGAALCESCARSVMLQYYFSNYLNIPSEDRPAI